MFHRPVRLLPRLATALAATTALTGGILVMLAAPALANPEGGRVVAGRAAIVDRGGGKLVVQQKSDKAVVDWRRFGIAKGEHTHFDQPGKNAVILNRVTGKEASTIAGRLTADGKVILLNPAGVLFTEDARVDVHGLIASTSRLDTQDFMAGRLAFKPSGNPNAAVVNKGEITAREGGLVALVAPKVENAGTIDTRLGRVVLASGETFTADLYGDGLVQLEVGGEQAVKGLVQAGVIRAEGGTVQLAVAEAGALVDRVVNMTGVVEATRVAQQGGRIVLEGGEGGTVRVAGTLDAAGKAAGEQGGEVTLAAGTVELAETARIDVSGPAGGGTARLGGGYRGEAPLPGVEPARDVTVAKGAVIDADAKERGKGGTVVAWAEETTRFSGKVTARGGPAGGDGGTVETSAKGRLGFSGEVDVGASAGKAGTFLLDPRDIVIGSFDVEFNDDDEVSDGTVRRDDGGDQDFFINASALAEVDGNILLEATRDILVAQPIDITRPQGGTLTLDAGRNISGQAPVTLSATNPGQDMSLVLRAGGVISLPARSDAVPFPVDVDGDVSLSASRITGSGGGFSPVRAGRDLTRTSTDTVNIALTAGTRVYEAGRDLTMSFGPGAITIGAEAVEAGRNVSITTATGPLSIESGGIDVGGDATIAAQGGNVTLARQAVTAGGAASVTSATAAIVATDSGTAGAPHVTAGRTVLSAQSGIGSVSVPLATATGALDVTNAASGPIDIRISGAASLALTQAGRGTVTVQNDQDLTVTRLQAPGSVVDLASGSGNVSFAPGVAAGSEAAPLGSLEIDAAAIVLDDVFTIGGQTYTVTADGGRVTLNGTYATLGGADTVYGGAPDFTIDGPTLLAGATTIRTAGTGEGDSGDIRFGGTIDGPGSLAIDSGEGSVTLGGAVGATTPLAALAVDVASLALPNVTTTGNQTYTGVGTVSGAVRLESTAGTIDLQGGVQGTTAGQDDLTLIARGGPLALTGDLLGSVPLRNLTAEGQTLSLDGVGVAGTLDGRASGDITVDSVTAGQAIALTADSDGNGTGAIESTATAGLRASTIELRAAEGIALAGTGGETRTDSLSLTNTRSGPIEVRLAGALGETSPTLFAVDQVGGGAVTVTSGQDLSVTRLAAPGSAVQLTSTAGDVTFAAGVGAGSEAAPLGSFVVSAGSVTLNDVVTLGPQTYTATGEGGAVTLAGSYRTSGGGFTTNGPVVLARTGEPVLVDTTGTGEGGAITFNGRVDGTTAGGNDLTLRPGAGAVTFAGNVGEAVSLGTVRVESGLTLAAPEVEAGPGLEDEPTPLSVNLTQGVPAAEPELVVSGVPDGFALTDGTNRCVGPACDGRNIVGWALDQLRLEAPADLGGVSVPLAFELSGRVPNLGELPAVFRVAELLARSTSPTATATVTIAAVADAPVVSAGNVSGRPGETIPLRIEARSTDVDGSETVTVTISGLPEGATLSAGTRNEDGSYTLAPSELAGLTLTLPDSGAPERRIEVAATSREASNNAEATTSESFEVRLQLPQIQPVGDSGTRARERGLVDVVRNAEPARLPDVTPIDPETRATIVAQIAALDPLIEPAGPDESEQSKEAREEREKLEALLEQTFDPWEACPEVATVSTSWQNTPADAAFNRDPYMLPYTVDVFCGGYQLVGPAEEATGAYEGLSHVTRDYWTDERQALSPELLAELREAFGLPKE